MLIKSGVLAMRLLPVAVGLLLLGSTVVASPASAEEATPLRVQTIHLGTRTESDQPLRVRREQVNTFSAYAVSWASEADAGTPSVTARVRRAGRWSPWQRLDVDPEPATAGTRWGSSLVWTGPSDGIELELDGARARDVRLELIDPGERPGDAEAARLPGGLDDPDEARPPIRSRARWGADEGKMTWDPEYADSVRAITLHHTATGNDYGPGDVPKLIRSIYHYQAVSLEWGDIGYHVVLDRFGRLWEGRAGGLDKPVIGAHAGGFNTGTAGIGMLGTYSRTKVSGKVIESAARYTGWRLGSYDADPRGSTRLTGGPNTKYDKRVTITVRRVFPHNRTSATECPGAQGRAALEPIRRKAARYAS